MITYRCYKKQLTHKFNKNSLNGKLMKYLFNKNSQNGKLMKYLRKFDT